VTWKAPVPGRGWSSPVISDGRIWLTTSVEEREPASLRVLAYDVETGREIVNVEVFQHRIGNYLNPKNSYASPTPIVEGERVYVHFGAWGTAALTTSGEILWKARFAYESQHGNGGSPALYKDLLIISCDGADTAFVVALDKSTGKVRWSSAGSPGIRLIPHRWSFRLETATRSLVLAPIERPHTNLKRGKRSGESITSTAFQMFRVLSSAMGWFISPPGFKRHRCWPCVRMEKAT
jgi:hypothetical protein